MKYIQTERYLVERKARKSLFGLYKNRWTDHPCVKGVVDSTANTNIVYWVGRLLALRESANPYSVDPDTLQTYEYDPFGKQADLQVFTAHPKIDPFTEELIVFGYEAKGPG
jgi:carotenoid cleavage dioxygenase